MAEHTGAVLEDRSKLFWAIFGSLAVIATVASALFLRDKYMYGALVLATPLALIIVSSPRLALYQFVFFLFVKLSLFSETPVTLLDISATLVLAAGLIDYFLGQRERVSIPLAGLFALLIVALFIAAINAYNTSVALVHPTKVCFLFGVFLALVRLYRHINLDALLKVFLWIGATHATFALTVYLMSAGALRSFVLAPKALDDILMLALPLATSFALRATRQLAFVYSIVAILILGGLVATQSRAPIAFGILGSALTLALAYRRAGAEMAYGRLFAPAKSSTAQATIRHRVRLTVLVTGLISVLLVGFHTELFLTVGERFSALLTTDPGETFRLRLTLWKAALMAFQDHPWLGVGPSNFRSLEDIYTAYRLDPARLWVQGLSAHSLLLHYMAETGIVGATALMALIIRQSLLARKLWKNSGLSVIPNVSLGLYAVSIVVLLTTIVESAWTWGHVSFVAVFFLAAIAHCARKQVAVVL